MKKKKTKGSNNEGENNKEQIQSNSNNDGRVGSNVDDDVGGQLLVR